MSRLRFLKDGARYPRETRRIELGDYHDDLKGDYIEAWVNISRAVRNKGLDLFARANDAEELPRGEEREAELSKINEEMWKLHAEWWDMEYEDVKALYEIDTVLYTWLVQNTVDLRAEYAEGRKKVVKPSTAT